MTKQKIMILMEITLVDDIDDPKDREELEEFLNEKLKEKYGKDFLSVAYLDEEHGEQV